MKDRVEFFYLGPPKSASTWTYFCLADHPEINASSRGEPCFFDQHFHEGLPWFDGLYDAGHDGVRMDCTPGYIYNINALERIKHYNPDAKLAFALRHPVERTFSAYWHVRKRRDVVWTLDEVFDNHAAWRLWVDSSMISAGVEYLLANFPRENIHFFMFDDLKTQGLETVQNLYRFIGVDDGFVPPSLTKRINVAAPRPTLQHKVRHKLAGILMGDKLHQRDAQFNGFERWLSGKGEYLEGMKPELRAALLQAFLPEIDKLERLLNVDLSHWRGQSDAEKTGT